VFGRRHRRTRVSARPTNWEQFIGHREIVNTLREATLAARRRGELVRPVLLWGPPGCGKTTLCRLCANGQRVKELVGSTVAPRDITSAVQDLDGGYLLIDEIHALSSRACETLYPIMDDGIVKRGRHRQRVDVSVLASTTELAKVPRPLRDRFSITLYVPTYSEADMARLANIVARLEGLRVEHPGPEIVASYARGVPRWVNRIIEMATDISKTLDPVTASKAVKALGFDANGLLTSERQYLMALATLGGLSSLTRLAALMGHSASSVSEVEHFLLTRGLVEVTSRGRALTPAGREYVNLSLGKVR